MLDDQQTSVDAVQRLPLSPLHDMSQNTPSSKLAANPPNQLTSDSPSKASNTPARPPTGNRANRRTSADTLSGQKSPRRTASGFEVKSQGGDNMLPDSNLLPLKHMTVEFH